MTRPKLSPRSLDLNTTFWPDSGWPPLRTVAFAVVVDEPSARIDDGLTLTVILVAAFACAASGQTQNPLTSTAMAATIDRQRRGSVRHRVAAIPAPPGDSLLAVIVDRNTSVWRS